MRTAGLSVDVLSEYFSLIEQGDETIEARKEILQEQRAQLLARMAELQETLDLLNYKIEVYEDAVLKNEQRLIDLWGSLKTLRENKKNQEQ
jgi:DNA-binding transcriptional MerR regulator